MNVNRPRHRRDRPPVLLLATILVVLTTVCLGGLALALTLGTGR